MGEGSSSQWRRSSRRSVRELRHCAPSAIVGQGRARGPVVRTALACSQTYPRSVGCRPIAARVLKKKVVLSRSPSSVSIGDSPRFVEEGGTVLLASHTDIAVDEAILRAAGPPHGPLYDTPAYRQGRLLRFGPPRHPDLGRITELQAESVAKRLGSTLEARLQEVPY